MKLSEGGAVGPEYGRDEEENFFKRLGKWRSGRRNPSKLHHTEEKDGRPPPPPWGAPLAHPMPPSFFVCSSLLLSSPLFVAGGVVFCLASQVVVFWQCCRPPFSMSASPDSCLLLLIQMGEFSTHQCQFKVIIFWKSCQKNLPKTKANIKQQGKGKWTRCFIFSLFSHW